MGKYRAQNLLGDQYTRIYDASTNETIDIVGAKVKFYEDFINTQINTAAGGIVGWTKKDTGAQNVPPAILANQTSGVIQMGLDNTNEKQESGLYFGDALNFNLDKGVVAEFCAAVKTAPAAQAEIYFGLANAYVEGPIAEADAGPTVHAFFCFDGSLVCKIFADDDSTNNDAVATGITVVAEAFHIFRIDVLDVTSVKFYIDGARVGSATTISMANGTNVVTQPFIMCHKEADAGTAGAGNLYVDSVKFWQLSR